MTTNISPIQQQRVRELALHNNWRDRMPQSRQSLLEQNAEKRRAENEARTQPPAQKQAEAIR